MKKKLITDIFNMDRVLWHGDKLQQWQMGKNPYPVTMDLHLTGACNLKCPMCSGGERTGYLSRDFAIDILEQLRKGDVRGIVYTGGGEPTLHRKFSEIIQNYQFIRGNTGVLMIFVKNIIVAKFLNYWPQSSYSSCLEHIYFYRYFDTPSRTFQNFHHILISHRYRTMKSSFLEFREKVEGGYQNTCKTFRSGHRHPHPIFVC